MPETLILTRLRVFYLGNTILTTLATALRRTRAVCARSGAGTALRGRTSIIPPPHFDFQTNNISTCTIISDLYYIVFSPTAALYQIELKIIRGHMGSADDIGTVSALDLPCPSARSICTHDIGFSGRLYSIHTVINNKNIIIIDNASSSSASRVVLRVIVVDDHRRRPGNGDVVQRQVRFVAVPSGRGPAALDDQPAGLCAAAAAAAVFVVVVVVVVFAASSAPSVLVISGRGPVDGMLLLLLLTSAEPFDGQADQEKAHGGRQCDYSLHEYRSDVEAQVEQRVQRARQALHFLQTRSVRMLVLSR
ncbi:hypothetical protein AGLY_009266 [Aphis glycines]|uniref:Uncharacterized protein n=1 Tax=Aphis glycines TaxID=307491 RepID=A0A6G0TJ36_APHGL|nr:hypothetical protein AGLY_009266 [Aphis glycines]